MTPDSSSRAASAARAATLVLLAGFALAGCSTVKGWFGGKSDKDLQPMALVDFTPSVQVDRIWSSSAGGGSPKLGALQSPTVDGQRVYVAATRGGVSALDLGTGQAAWHHETEQRLSSAPGAGDGLVVVGGLEGDVIALDAASGAEKWTATVNAEVLAAPTIGQGLVLVHSNDGRVTAFDEATGERRWFWDQVTPTLSVRGNGSALLGPGFAFIGNDDGKLSSLSLSDGRLLWEQVVAAPEGRNELDRMADVDGTPALEGTTIYATSYKRHTMAIDGPSGRPLWSGDAGGPGRVAVGPQVVVVTDPDGTVWALDKNSGTAMWQQDGLGRRVVSAPAIQGDYAVVGDYEGMLHWLQLSNGAFAARLDAGDAVRAAPTVAADGTLVVETVSGEVSAYRLH